MKTAQDRGRWIELREAHVQQWTQLGWMMMKLVRLI